MSDEDRCGSCTWDGEVVVEQCDACEASCKILIDFLTDTARFQRFLETGSTEPEGDSNG